MRKLGTRVHSGEVGIRIRLQKKAFALRRRTMLFMLVCNCGCSVTLRGGMNLACESAIEGCYGCSCAFFAGSFRRWQGTEHHYDIV